MDEPATTRRGLDRPRGKMRKGMYLLPSLFTSANMAAGFYAILQTIIKRHRTLAPRLRRESDWVCRAL